MNLASLIFQAIYIMTIYIWSDAPLKRFQIAMKIPQSCLTAPHLISPSNFSFKYTQFALWPLHLPRPPIKTRKTYKRFEAARSCGEPLEDPEMYNSLKQWKFAARGLRHEIRRGQRAREFNYREINYDMATWLFCRAGANADEPTSFRKRAAAVASNSKRERERAAERVGWLRRRETC